MQPNLVFLSGPHGSGKTTLGRELANLSRDILIPELYSRNPKFNLDNPSYRQYLKLCSRAIENFEYLDIARKNPEKIILANRGIYDVLAYHEIYFKRGWIRQEEFELLNCFSLETFKGELRNPYAIVVNPGFDVVMQHLQKRWQEKGKKWREDDLEYAKLACLSFEQFRENSNIFYIDHEINLETKVEVFEAFEWLRSLREPVHYPATTQISELLAAGHA